MSRTSIILLTLIAVVTGAWIFVGSNPQQAAMIAQMQREAALSPYMREIVLGILAMGIGIYLVYIAFFRGN